MSKLRVCVIALASVIAASALPVSAQATGAETVTETERRIKAYTVAIERAEKAIEDLSLAWYD